jgi:hypothetical protein
MLTVTVTKSDNPNSRDEPGSSAAQDGILLYRRLVICVGAKQLRASIIAVLCRMPFGDTADCQSALLDTGFCPQLDFQ